MSQAPSPGSSSSGSTPYGNARDPVVAIIEDAGHEADSQVIECAQLAAAAHAQRAEDGKADGRAVNRSTFLWALGRVDYSVRAALESRGVQLAALQNLLGIRDEPPGLRDAYELAEDLARALRTFAQRPSKMQLTITPLSLAVAVLEDVLTHGGLLGDRLRRLGADPDGVLAQLRHAQGFDSGPTGDDPGASSLPLMRDITARQFGVVLPPGTEDAGPYVPRDIDDVLRRQLRERLPVVAVVAQVGSGAIRTVYEGLRQERPDDRVLLLHEWLGEREGAGGVTPEDVDRLLSSGADLVWVRSFGELADRNPIVKDWVLARGDRVAATVVLIVRPDDVSLAAELGLAPATSLELNVALSAEEQARADSLYQEGATTVSDIAGATVRRHGVVRANYAADSAAAQLLNEANDDLDVRADIDMLAKLIASKDVKPPLSIGLFGPWGSGKSFLMHQVQLRIKDLAERSKAIPADTEGQTTGYLTEVIPVEFNAWQYAHGTALWAALINRVFEGIREQLGNDARYQKVLRDIADKDVGVAQARVKVQAAQSVVAKSRPAAADRVINEVAKDHGMSDDSTKQINEGLNLDVARQQVSDLRVEYDRLMTARSRLSTGWSRADTGRRVLIAALVVVGIAALGVFLLAPEVFGQLLALVTGALSFVGAATKVLRPVNQGLEQAAKVLRVADADKQKLQDAQDELMRATEKLTKARASGLAGLYGFVSERSGAAEYKQQLGMAPMIRDDLERLATKSREDDGIPGIDRIVIYIDDLDRCPASQVVQVLEAVNLLFGFELFVVVVAVDSRWLLRSLDTEFSAAFDKDDSSAPTPQNYLEKIIQIPFWVQPMRPVGFGRLVTSLAGKVTQSPTPTTPPQGATNTTPDGRSTAPASPSVPKGIGHEDPVEEPTPGGGSDPPPSETGGGAGGGKGTTPTDETDDKPPDDLNPEALRLTSNERDCMTRFLPLVGTPRAAKRFINTYQLLRVTVADVDAFLAAKEYEPVLVLLALVTGTVPVRDPMIAELATMTQTDFGTFLAAVVKREMAEVPPKHDWQTIAAACADLPTGALTPELITTWLPKVARYSFHRVEW
ncbi:MAG: P-loop NTPase fold protein [Knoellia sp.]